MYHPAGRDEGRGAIRPLTDDFFRLRGLSTVVGSGQEELKKGLRIDFLGEEGVDAGGIRKEWFLLLIREVFDEAHGLSNLQALSSSI